jgi:hypothetical protein
MTSWQEAMNRVKAEQDTMPLSHNPSALILNTECENGAQTLAGSVEWSYRTATYSVHNANTQQERSGLSSDQVEQALIDLGIANSDWR